MNGDLLKKGLMTKRLTVLQRCLLVLTQIMMIQQRTRISMQAAWHQSHSSRKRQRSCARLSKRKPMGLVWST